MREEYDKLAEEARVFWEEATDRARQYERRLAELNEEAK